MRTLVILAVLALTACYAEAPRASSTNGEIIVVRLTSVDDCTVFRFKDGGEMHYFTRCGASADTTTTSVHVRSCGEGCTEHVPEEIPTVVDGVGIHVPTRGD